MRPAGRSLGRFVDLGGTVCGYPHAISDAGYWNDWLLWLRGQDLNLNRTVGWLN